MDVYLTRRACLALAAAGVSGPALAADGRRFAAAWEDAAGAHVGLVQVTGESLLTVQAAAVPTRAHGLLSLGDGSLLALARRPGDWMLRWRPGARAPRWFWIEPARAFNGHAGLSADRTLLFTSETDLDSGQGLVGVRDSASLRKLAEWPTHGVDPHELLVGAAGTLWVANGGIRTRPETGRSKREIHRMDSSLVRLDARTGALRGQWRLEDPRLSLRHLAWGRSKQGRPILGIALQAQHEERQTRAAAPVLALFDGGRLRAAAAPGPALGGYGGAIAHAGGRFAVSCTRGEGVALFDTSGTLQGVVALGSACAVASRYGQLWAAGAGEAVQLTPRRQRLALPAATRFDNHWLAWT